MGSKDDIVVERGFTPSSRDFESLVDSYILGLGICMRRRTMNIYRHLIVVLILSAMALLQVACDIIQKAPIPLPGTGPSDAATTSPNSLVYDAPVSLSIKTGATLPGTTVGYSGKTPGGAAKVLLGGQVAEKQRGDTLDWRGTPVPNLNLNLSTRVVTFDDMSITVVGTAHIELASIAVQPGGTFGDAPMEFSAPVTYSLAKNVPVPGTNISYIASSAEGAQFSGIQGYAYRKPLDSLQYIGRLNPKVMLKLDLRVLNFSDTNVLLGGTANLSIVP